MKRWTRAVARGARSGWLCGAGVLCALWAQCGPVQAQATAPVALWPTIPFIRGQDLCQYQDAYGRSAAEISQGLTRNLTALLRAGADPSRSVELLQAIVETTHEIRDKATAGYGMDVLLEGSFKAALDGVYAEQRPRQRNLTFFNPAPLNDLVRELRDEKRQGYLDAKTIKGLSGIAWGTYSFSPLCRGDVVVTLHIEAACGQTYNFRATGRPEAVMRPIALQAFARFQSTGFPSKVRMGHRTLELIGAPGHPIGVAATTAIAEGACASLQARLPTEEEYEFLSVKGDWNGGVCLSHNVWALKAGNVLAPDYRNPSPIRRADEFVGTELRFYCVR